MKPLTRKEIADCLLGKIGCDACDEKYGDYQYTLEWNEEKKLFVCSLHPDHTESFGQATRHINDDNYHEILNAIETMLTEE